MGIVGFIINIIAVCVPVALLCWILDRYNARAYERYGGIPPSTAGIRNGEYDLEDTPTLGDIRYIGCGQGEAGDIFAKQSYDFHHDD